MLNVLAFAANMTALVSGIRIALLALSLIAAVFIIVIVMKQSGNSDGMEAMTGSSRSDDSETYYGKNAGSRKERILKILTYVAAGVIALVCIVLLILQTFVK